ncbi:hypothetical protein L0F63_007265 [Massospora cicadina]|nr:hypothetical protein L0F63_007265 [Massospora cicadina]
MVLSQISRLKLLTEVELVPRVLAAFPERVAAGLVRDVTEMLLDERRESLELSTPTHVEWVMQVVGHGFALPLSHTLLIESCVVIYSQWLLEMHTRPAWFSKGGDVQPFIQQILLSLSQIFDFRPGTGDPCTESADAIQKYVDLSKHVIALYASVGRALGASMSKATWKVLMACLLGAADHFFGMEDGDSPTPALSLATDLLCDPLMRALLEGWIRSGVCDANLWNALQRSFAHWAHRPAVISHWNSVCLALTQGMVQRTYAAEAAEEVTEVTVNTNGYNLTLPFSKDALAILWYKFLFLLDPAKKLPDASHALVLQGVSHVVERLDVSSPHRPSGNTILRLVGSWLFGATSHEARGTALTVLCRLFSRRPIASFSEPHRESLFRCLDSGLEAGQDAQPIFLYSSGLLGQPAAALVLLPRLMAAFRTVVPTLTPGFRLVVPLDQVRRGILKCVAAVLSIPSRFPETPIPSGWLPAGHVSLPYGLDVLCEGTQTDAANFRFTLDLLALSTAQMPPVKQEILTNGLIKAITAQVVRSSSGIHLALACFEIAGRLLEGHALRSNYARDFAWEPAGGLVEAIATCINRFLKEDDLEYSFQAIVAAYLALARWAEALSRTCSMPSCVSAAFRAICLGLGGSAEPNVVHRQRNPLATLPQRNSRPRSAPSSPKSQCSSTELSLSASYDMGCVQVVMAARVALAKFMALFHHSCQTRKELPVQDLVLALEQLDVGLGHPSCTVQYFFLYPDTVVGVCEFADGRPACVITRDPFGTTCLNVSPAVEASPQSQTTPLSLPAFQHLTPPESPREAWKAASPPPSIPGSSHELDAPGEVLAQKRMQRFPSQRASEASSNRSAHCIARQLLTQLGLLHESECLAPLPLSSALLETLTFVDHLPTRVGVPLCLLYTSDSLPSLASLHNPSAQGVPESFMALAASLTADQARCEAHPVCTSLFADFFLSCPGIISQSTPPPLGSVGPPTITVLYYDAPHVASYAYSPDLPSQLLATVGGPNAFLILVAPEFESQGLYRVRLAGPANLMSRGTHPWVGPLADDVVVTHTSSSQLIRSTALSMKLKFLSHMKPHLHASEMVPNPWLNPYLARASILAQVGDMASPCIPTQSASHFLSTLFHPIPTSLSTANPTTPTSDVPSS